MVTDDVRKLKSLKVTPDLDPKEVPNYYREPIWIEYYIPKESRFAYETKFLFIYLVDPPPRTDNRDRFLREAADSDKFFDLIEFMDQNPEQRKFVEDSYHDRMSMFESIHASYENYQSTQNPSDLKTTCYFVEALMKFEPTVASLDLFPDFLLYNLNWLIRALNRARIQFSLEDTTISLLIKRRNDHWEKNNLPEDEDFDLFAALFYEQAFPHRGAEELEPDDFLME